MNAILDAVKKFADGFEAQAFVDLIKTICEVIFKFIRTEEDIPSAE